MALALYADDSSLILCRTSIDLFCVCKLLLAVHQYSDREMLTELSLLLSFIYFQSFPDQYLSNNSRINVCFDEFVAGTSQILPLSLGEIRLNKYSLRLCHYKTTMKFHQKLIGKRFANEK